MVPGEALPVFVHDIKQLLDQAMPGLDAKAKEQLLLHQLMAGLPATISKQLRATASTTTLQSAVERAKLLTLLEIEQQAAAVTSPSNPANAIVEKLSEQVAALTDQVAALSALQQTRTQHEFIPRIERPILRCYHCGKARRNCRNLPANKDRNRAQYQGNFRGVPAEGNRHPARQ